MKHYSVLKSEAIDALNIKSDGIYVDATVGYAGDSIEILKRIKNGYLYGFDQDDEAIKYSIDALSKISNNFKLYLTNFVNMKEHLANDGVSKVDGILFDLGFSSPQIDDEKRGFSFMSDGPLDMRMSKSGISAKELINKLSEEELAKIFYEYGEEKQSRIIAKIVKKKASSINTTLELVEAIKEAVGANYFYKQHPERKIFQAIRIAVNDELNVLEKVLPDAINLLDTGGRLAVITFHSLEDRIVKKIFKKYSEVDPIVKGLVEIPDEYKPLIKVINKKVIIPTLEELNENSRSRSAKLRIVERI